MSIKYNRTLGEVQYYLIINNKSRVDGATNNLIYPLCYLWIEMGLKLGTQIAAIILTLTILCVAIFLNVRPQQSLFFMGVNYVYDMQVRSSPILTFIENLFSLLGQPLIMIGVFLVISQLVVVYKRKMVILVHLIYILAGQFLIGILKSILREPRPFWIQSQIGNWDWFCPADFGNPSGHSFFVFAMFEPILSDMIGTGKRVQLVLLVIIAVAVMASRMYLGAHSLNQVVFGAFLGCVYLVIYHYKLQQFFYKIVSDMLNQRHRLLYFIGNTIFCVSCIAISLITYQMNMENKPIESNWMDNITCRKKNEQALLLGMIHSITFVYGAVGIIYGFLLLDNSEGRDIKYFVGQWNFKDTKSRIIYSVAFVVVAIPFAFLYFLLPLMIQSNMVTYFSKVLGFMWAGMCLSFATPIILNKFDLIVYSLRIQSD